MELYLSGESFAGTFIPYIAKHILDVNKQQGSVKVTPCLKRTEGIGKINVFLAP